MAFSTAQAAALAFGALLAGCSDMPAEVAIPRPAVTVEPPSPSLQQRPAWDRTLAGLHDDDQRVANVAFRIATANAPLCPDRGPADGLVLQSALQYGPKVRAAAEAAFHLDARPSVDVVAADSPAAAAGLEPGDVLLRVDGRALPSPPSGVDGPASYAPIQAAQDMIGEALAKGSANLTVERSGASVAITLRPVEACAYDAQVLPGAALNASADGRHVFITSALVSYAAGDDQLALVLGHEFAHDLLQHHERLDRHGLARGVLGDLGSTPASLWTAEREADYVGLYLTARAGYDISRAPDFWLTFPGGGDELDWSHPPPAERARLLAAARDEILAKEARRAPLTPEPASARSP